MVEACSASVEAGNIRLMIEKIVLENFKSHAHTEIELGSVTALVGPNGCGKTSVLQAIRCFCLGNEQSLNEVFDKKTDPDRLVKQGLDNFQISLEGATNGKRWKVILYFQQVGFAEWQPSLSLEFLDSNTEGAFEKSEISWQQSYFKRQLVARTLALPTAVYFKPNPDRLAEPSYLEETEPRVAMDGSGLASAVAYLITTTDDNARSLFDALQAIVPTVQRSRVKPAKIIQREKKVFAVNETRVPYEETVEFIGHELFFDTVSATGIPAYATSDGTLLTLGILTALYQASPNQLVLIDDIEYGLHALAQRSLMQAIKRIATERNLQVVLTTHSGYITDELEAEDVWVMTTDKAGVTHCKQLSTHPDAKRLLEVLTTGELESAVGEEWVLPKEPVAEVANA